MPITIRCPRCGEIRFVADDEPASTVTCSGCQATLRIPGRAVEAHTPSAPLDELNPFADHAATRAQAAVETENPYQSPTFTPAVEFNSAKRFTYGRLDPRLASRGKRFAGSLLDSLFVAGPFFAVMITVNASNADEDAGLMIGMGLGAVVLLIDTVMIATRGQSLAKYILGMQIVKADSERLPGFVYGILLRSFVPAIIGRLPFVGGFFSLADALYIFGEERQCLHDKIANTKVLDRKLMELYAKPNSDDLQFRMRSH